MRVHKGDLIRIEQDGEERIMVARQLDAPNNRLLLAEHFQTGNLDKRDADSEDPFNWLRTSYNKLRSLKAERIQVDELGRRWRVAAE
jgi:CRISPR-associated endonuclease Csn1